MTRPKIPDQSSLIKLSDHYKNNKYKDAEKLATSLTKEFPTHSYSWKVLGAIFGLTRDTGNKEIIKATLESLAYQSKDVIDVMIKDSNVNLNGLRVDGGASMNNYLMQFQSNLLNCNVIRPKIIETTAMGVGYLAGIKSSLWDKDKIISNQKIDQVFNSKINQEKSLIINFQ